MIQGVVLEPWAVAASVTESQQSLIWHWALHGF